LCAVKLSRSSSLAPKSTSMMTNGLHRIAMERWRPARR
jgi:hypothetical protein